MDELKLLTDYFKPKEFAPKYYTDNSKKFSNGGKRCFKDAINDMFNTDISCEKYSSVISGEGKEEDKINTFYSSSLQTLLFFSSVNEQNPLIFEGVKYTKVYFEVKNTVINSPASVDAVLVGKAEKDKNTVLFIETKLYEVIRDSSDTGKAVIGRSYFSSKKNSYCSRFSSDVDDMTKLGIESVPNKDGKYTVSPIENAEYVYSYGIKQLLSHIIGILDFKENGTKNYPDIDKSSDARFLTLVNAMPEYGNPNSGKITSDFINHYNKVIEYLKAKNIAETVKMYNCMTFQDFYSEVNQSGYKLNKEIVKYYHYEKKNESK